MKARPPGARGKAVVVDKITGPAVYNAMYAGAFTSKDTLGTTGDMAFTKDAPFPTQPMVRVLTVKGGQVVGVSPSWYAPPVIPRW